MGAEEGIPFATVFRDVKAQTQRRKPLAELLDEIEGGRPACASKAACPLFSPFLFGDRRTKEGSLRSEANALQAYAIVGDYDGEETSPEIARDVLADLGVRALIATTGSHSAEKPRFRVIAPTAHPVPKQDYPKLVARLNGALEGALADESFAVGQSYYFGRVNGAAFVAYRVEGRCIDELPELDAVAVGKHTRADGLALAADPTPDAVLRERIHSGDDGVQRALLALAARWIARGMAAEDVNAALVALIDEVPWREADAERWWRRRNSIPRAVATAQQKFGDRREQQPEKRTQLTDENAEVKLMNGSDLNAEPVSWLWKNHLARGKLHLIAGPPGANKTTAAMALAATLTQGGRWPDGSRATPASVVIWSGEDGVEDTLIARLKAHEAEMTRIYFVAGARDPAANRSRAFDPAHDMEALALAAARISDLGLVIIDPVVLAITGDSHKGAEVRKGLAPLVALAEITGAAALGITHFSKNTAGRHPLERVTGSHAFGAAARVVFACARLQGNDRVFVRVKNNLGPDGGGFVFTVVPLELDGCETIRLEWGTVLTGDARDILATADLSVPNEKAEDDIVKWLRETLKDAGGEMERTAILKAAKSAGFSESAMDRARKRGKFTTSVAGFPRKSVWRLPLADSAAPTNGSF